MKIISMLLLSSLFITSAISCSNFSFNEDAQNSRRTLSNHDDDIDSLTNLDKLKDNIEELVSDSKGKKDCATYEHPYESHKITEGFFGGLHPTKAVENCMIYLVDEGARPLCEREKKLFAAQKKHENNDSALEQIDDALLSVEELKFEISTSLYAFQDGVLDLSDKLYEQIEESNDNAFTIAGLKLLVTTEVKSSAYVFDGKGKNLCNFKLLL